MISLVFISALIAAAVLIPTGVGAVLFGMSARRKHIAAGRSYDSVHDWWFFPVMLGGAVLLFALPGFGIGLYPYDMAYHSYRPVAGEIETVTSRLLGSDGGGSTQNYVVRFHGDRTLYRCDDSRCSALRPGDHLRLMCIREWQYGSVDGYRCRYAQEG